MLIRSNASSVSGGSKTTVFGSFGIGISRMVLMAVF